MKMTKLYVSAFIFILLPFVVGAIFFSFLTKPPSTGGLLDTFSWGSGTARSELTLNTELNNIAPETQSSEDDGRVWAVSGLGASATVFDGQPGSGNGWLTTGSNTAVKIELQPFGKIMALMDWSETPAIMGWQVSSPNKNLLVNQTTDKVFCQVTRNAETGIGTLQIVCRANGVTSSDSATFSLTNDTIRIGLRLDMDAGEAEASVQDLFQGTSARA
jgi:hypothetical protein